MHNLPARGIGLTSVSTLLVTFGYGIGAPEVSKGMWPPVTRKKPVVEPLPERQRRRIPVVAKTFGPASIPAPRSTVERQAIERALDNRALLEAAHAIREDLRVVTRDAAAKVRAERALEQDDEEVAFILSMLT